MAPTERTFNYGPIVELPIPTRTETGIKVRTPRDVWFHDAGPVPSVSDTVFEIARRAQAMSECRVEGGTGWVDRQIDRLLDRLGLSKSAKAVLARTQEAGVDLRELDFCCLPQPIDEATTAYVLAQRAGLDPSTSAFARGYTSAQFLNAMARHPLPKNAPTGVIEDPLAEYQPANRQVLQGLLDAEGIRVNALDSADDTFANIGGLLALRVARISEEDISVPNFANGRAVKTDLASEFGL